MTGRPITVSSWPAPGENQYLQLYSAALGRHGVAAGPTAVFSDDWLRQTAGTVDAVHIQWTPERLWRNRGDAAVSRLRGLAGLWRYLRLARRLGVKVVWTLHDVERHEGNGRLDDAGYRLLARRADLTIVHDEWAADQFVRRLGGRPDRVCVMELGNYDGVFPPARPRADTLAALGVDPARRVLVGQGLVRPYKGFGLAVGAARALGPGYHLVVAGRPHEPAFGDDLRRAAAGAANVTLLLDGQTDQAVSDLIAAADCFLLPYTKITGSAALLTACTLGRGFVASDLPYFRRAVEREPQAGELFRPGDAAGLAAAVRRFFAGPADERHRAARRLADRAAWADAVRPVVDWYRKAFPGRVPGEGPVAA